MHHPSPATQAPVHSSLTIHLNDPTGGGTSSKHLRSGQKLSGAVLLPSHDAQGGGREVRVVGYVVIGAGGGRSELEGTEQHHHHHHIHRPESYRAEFGSCTLTPQASSENSRLAFEFQLPSLQDKLTFHPRSTHHPEGAHAGSSVEALAPPSFESKFGGEHSEKTLEKDLKEKSAHFVEWIVEASYGSDEGEAKLRSGEEKVERAARETFSFIPSEISIQERTEQNDASAGTKGQTLEHKDGKLILSHALKLSSSVLHLPRGIVHSQISLPIPVAYKLSAPLLTYSMDLSLEKTKLATGEAKIYSVEVELVRVTRVVRRHHTNGKAKEDVVEEEGVVRKQVTPINATLDFASPADNDLTSASDYTTSTGSNTTCFPRIMFDLQAITGDNTALSKCAPTFRAPGLSVEYKLRFKLNPAHNHSIIIGSIPITIIPDDDDTVDCIGVPGSGSKRASEHVKSASDRAGAGTVGEEGSVIGKREMTEGKPVVV